MPTAADDVVATAESGNLTLTEGGNCKSIDFTNYTKTFTHNSGISLTIGGNEGGSCKFVPGMTYVVGSSSSNIGFNAGGTNPTMFLTTAGKELGKVIISQCNLKLEDNLKLKGVLEGLNAFHLDASACTEITLERFQKVSANPTSIKNGNTVWNVFGTSGVLMELAAEGGLTFEEGAKATIKVTSASASTRTITFGTNTIGTVTYEVNGSTGSLMLTHTNATVNTINFLDANNARTLQLSATRTLKVTDFNVKGSAGKLMTVKSQTGGSKTTLEKTSGVVECDYISLQDCKAQGGALWFAGANSTIGTNVEGWLRSRQRGESTLSASATLTASASRKAGGSASLATTASLTASGTRRAFAGSSLSASATLNATSVRRQFSSADLSGSASMDATAGRILRAAGHMEATGYMSAQGVARRFGRSQLSASAGLDAECAAIRFAQASLTVETTMVVTPVRRRISTAVLESSASLKATAKRLSGVGSASATEELLATAKVSSAAVGSAVVSEENLS